MEPTMVGPEDRRMFDADFCEVATPATALSPVSAWVPGGRAERFEAESGTPREAAGGAP